MINSFLFGNTGKYNGTSIVYTKPMGIPMVSNTNKYSNTRIHPGNTMIFHSNTKYIPGICKTTLIYSMIS